MAELSKITLPSGNTYELKDTTARQMIAGGVSFTFCTDASNTPLGISWKNESGTTITGILSANDAASGAFYMVPIYGSTGTNIYEEYVAAGTVGSKKWEMMGNTKVTISIEKVDVAKVTSAGSVTQGSKASFTQGTDSFTANTPTTPASIDTTKFYGGSFSRGTFNGGSGSFTQGTFSGGSFTQGTDTFSATVTDETLTISFTQGVDSFTPATHGSDSHTHTSATHAADSFTAASLGNGFYTAGNKGSAASFTQGTDSFTENNPTSVTLPTFGTETVVKSVTA